MFASFIDGMCCITIFAYFPVKTHYPRPEKSICGLSICSVFLICLYHNYWWCLLGLLFFPSSQYTHPLFSSLKQAMTPNPRAETAAIWLQKSGWSTSIDVWNDQLAEILRTSWNVGRPCLNPWVYLLVRVFQYWSTTWQESTDGTSVIWLQVIQLKMLKIRLFVIWHWQMCICSHETQNSRNTCTCWNNWSDHGTDPGNDVGVNVLNNDY
jgi:hypothetical protein